MSTKQVTFKNFNLKLYAPILYHKLQESCCFLCRKRRGWSSATAHTQSKERGQNFPLKTEAQSCAGLDIQAPVPPQIQGSLTEDVAAQGVWGKALHSPCPVLPSFRYHMGLTEAGREYIMLQVMVTATAPSHSYCRSPTSERATSIVKLFNTDFNVWVMS